MAWAVSPSKANRIRRKERQTHLEQESELRRHLKGARRKSLMEVDEYFISYLTVDKSTDSLRAI